jgi:hypothetical protein
VNEVLEYNKDHLREDSNGFLFLSNILLGDFTTFNGVTSRRSKDKKCTLNKFNLEQTAL